MDAIAAFADHVVATRLLDLPGEVIQAAKASILDTLGVGIAGSSQPGACELAQMQQECWGTGAEALVWGNGKRLPAAASAMCNAYQVHSSEFDCLHEQAVVHAMTVVLPVATAAAERRKAVSGAELLTAVTLGVDIAAGLGVAATTGLRFFRPATAGAFGGAAAAGKLMALDRPGMVNAFSIAYAQACGTMQAHAEGSALLAMQMGFNARNALTACDLAAHGFAGPKDVLEGQFGYFKLFETAGCPARVASKLGRRWFISELAHKPFPSGRATHGIIEACLALRQMHKISADAIDRVTARVPPLVHRLVGRPPQERMQLSYARLCAPYLAARALLAGDVAAEAFTAKACSDPLALGLARRIVIEAKDAGDPNQLTPIEVEIRLQDGSQHLTRLEVVCGNPAKPLTRAALIEKFHTNCEAAARPLAPAKRERLIEGVEHLEDVPDVAELMEALH